MMDDQRHIVELNGCTPIPLAHYLKALGVLRLVAEQVDPNAQGWWRNDRFLLRSRLSRTDLEEFFLNKYRPTPLVAPWNGGSGFFPKDNQVAIQAILTGHSERFTTYREIIGLCKELLERLSLAEKPIDVEKPQLLQLCRNRFPDSVLSWLDAAYLLTADGPKYPPLLGTGGNDGRLEFTNNYMQRLSELFDCESGEPLRKAEAALEEALFATQTTERSKAPVGQFDPGSAGGPNSTAGYDAAPGINLWDFVLMLEGAIAFAAAPLKKLESAAPGVLAYPFCVRPTGVGYGSAAISDESASRSEMWMPIWGTPSSFHVLSIVLAEGRVETNRRHARTGIDFARAIAALGIDRGISAFQRFGFQQRNGLSYFAVPLGRFDVRGDPGVEELLSPLDAWLDRFRRAATTKTAPARAGRALRRLESAIFDLCQQGRSEDIQTVLVALGDAEAAVAVSRQLRESVAPVPFLDVQWLEKSNDASTEFRLAAALASVYHSKVGPLRQHLEPIDPNSWTARFPRWAKEADDPAIVWGGGDLVRNLNAVLKRRMVQVLQLGKEQTDSELFVPLNGRCTARLGDIAAFIEGKNVVNDQRIESLLRGLMLVNWRSKKLLPSLRGPDEPLPSAAFALLKLCHLPEKLGPTAIKLSPQILQRAIAGDGPAATQLAARRLRACGYPSAVETVPIHGKKMRRIAAALVFPISSKSTERLTDSVLRRDEFGSDNDENDAEPEPVTATVV